MAEVAGLVLGTLALVGVFEDCVGLISQIAAAKSMGQDYEILETKLDIEKTLLLQWADRLQLFKRQQYDKRLDDPEIRVITERTLGCIRLLLQDGTDLQSRYGVLPAKRDEDIQASSVMSRRLMSRFHKDSQDLTQWHNKQLYRLDQKDQLVHLQAENRRNGFSTFTKIKWVIKDKERFECLIRDLSELIASLNKMLPPLHQEGPARTQLRKEINRVQDIGMLKAILHASTDYNTDLIDETNKAITAECARLVLDRLWFRLIDDRRQNIADAYSQTLEWAIHPPISTATWSDLNKWLRSGRDIYWVSGKPGSGKSTLMKYLYDHPAVKNMLKEWAGDRTLTMASFFLWNLGTEEQKSQKGLARGLLYHVLSVAPSLIPVTLPSMWREAQSDSMEIALPSEKELSQAFMRLGTDVQDGAYVFFIDGLDEFSGDHRYSISFVQQLAKCPNIKVLLSSRPIDTCVAAFSSKPNLALQDLTKGDIELYVANTVRSHPYVAELKALDDAVTERLIDDLQKKAAGVFLWVVLACRSLLEGFAAFDNPSELQGRVDELPPELKDLFRHILDRISPRYLTQAAKLLQICYKSRLLEISDSISTLALAWADGNNLSIPSLQSFKKQSLEEQRAKCAMLEGRLRSRCMGLLEVHRVATLHSGPLEGLVNSSVDFMHRTVFEFLNTPGIWDLDCLQTNDSGFDATIVLSYMSSFLLYLQDTPLEISDYTRDLTRESVVYAQKLEEIHPTTTSSTLSHLALALMQQREKSSHGPISTHMYTTSTERYAIDVERNSTNQHSFFFGLDENHLALDDAALLLAIEANMISFVRDYDVATFVTSQSRNIFQQYEQYPLLYHAMNQPLLSKISKSTWQLPSSEIFRILLNAGCDLNERFLGPAEEISTPWETWRTLHCVRSQSPQDALQAAEITVIMLQSGAPLTASYVGAHTLTHTPYDWRDEMVEAAGKWLESADDASDGFDRRRLLEYCDEIIRVVGSTSLTASTLPYMNKPIPKQPPAAASDDGYGVETHDVGVEGGGHGNGETSEDEALWEMESVD